MDELQSEIIELCTSFVAKVVFSHAHSLFTASKLMEQIIRDTYCSHNNIYAVSTSRSTRKWLLIPVQHASTFLMLFIAIITCRELPTNSRYADTRNLIWWSADSSVRPDLN